MKPPANPLYLRDADLRQAIELLFFGYRDFTGDADNILAEFGLGRAHHRAIYFIGANPGITVGQLLDILRITKQSLSRVLNQLVDDDFVQQNLDAEDRRRRCLYLTKRGQNLESQLTEIQSRRIAKAYRDAGAESVAGFRTVLHGLINEEDQSKVASPVKSQI